MTTTTKVTIEEPGKRPVTIECESFAMVHISPDVRAMRAEVVASDPFAGDNRRGTLLAIGVLELAEHVHTAFGETAMAPLMKFVAKVGRRLAGIKRDEGAARAG
jgi:hypothetical protein